MPRPTIGEQDSTIYSREISPADDFGVNPNTNDAKNPRPLEEEITDKFSFTYYEPIYFLYGESTTRINFSFKYEFFRNVPFYMGYVQNIFWLLSKRSKPFKDADFNPRFFYRFDLSSKDTEDYIDLIGYEHKSNGKEGKESRSFDSFGAKFSTRWEIENFSIKTSLKGLARYKFENSNPDYYRYIGPYEFGLALAYYSYSSFLNRTELTYRLGTAGRYGEDFKRLTNEVGLSVRPFNGKWIPSFYIQYFNGYGESLVNYNKKEEVYRIGVIL